MAGEMPDKKGSYADVFLPDQAGRVDFVMAPAGAIRGELMDQDGRPLPNRRLWLNGEKFDTPHLNLEVLDRIGGGDGFASGLIYGLMTGRKPADALRLGWAHGALLTTYSGDVTMARLSEVESLATGRAARVDR